jgi:hypothetical protein
VFDDPNRASKMKSVGLTVFGGKSSKNYKKYLHKITSRIININRASRKFKTPFKSNDDNNIELSHFFRGWERDRNAIYSDFKLLPTDLLIEEMIPHMLEECFFDTVTEGTMHEHLRRVKEELVDTNKQLDALMG